MRNAFTSLFFAGCLAVALVGCDAVSADGAVASGAPNFPGPEPASSTTETGSGVTPRLIEGNIAGNGDIVCKTEAVVGPGTGWWGFVVDPPLLGTTDYGQFTLVISDDGRTLDWTANGTNQIRHVVVKGGPDTYVYDYDGTFTADTGLISPPTRNGNTPQISHFAICYDERF